LAVDWPDVDLTERGRPGLPGVAAQDEAHPSVVDGGEHCEQQAEEGQPAEQAKEP
jgi:hypothetical protein